MQSISLAAPDSAELPTSGFSPVLRRLRDLLRERGWLESATPWTAHSAALLRGRWGRRQLRLAQWPGERTLQIRLALREGPGLRVRRATLLQRLDPRPSKTRARLGPLLLNGDPRGLAKALARPARGHLATLFGELGLGELDLSKRWARARRECELDPAQASYFSERVLVVLAGLSEVCEEPAGPRLSARIRAVLRCPYCHDALRPGAEPTASCGVCGTLHHRSCSLEASACTTLGCSSLVFHAVPLASPSALVGAPIS